MEYLPLFSGIGAAFCCGVAALLAKRRKPFEEPMTHVKYLAVLALSFALASSLLVSFITKGMVDAIDTFVGLTFINMAAYALGAFIMDFVHDMLQEMLG